MRKEPIELIYQDSDILVINKPSGVSVTKDRTRLPQLVDFLAGQIGNEPTARLRLVHRLDKDTSGVMILARNRETQRKFADYFSDRKVKKTYLALVRGAVLQNKDVIDSPIGHSKKKPELMIIDTRHGKESLTEWRLLADFGPVSLLAVNPLTGRTHQIRVHLASTGLSIAIDPLYGSNMPIMLSEFKKDYHLGKFQEEKPLIDRLTLHAYQIVIPESYVIPAESSVIPAEPVLSEPVPPAPAIRRPGSEVEGVEGAGINSNCFVAPLDKKFTATIKMLTKHNSQGPSAFFNPDDLDNILSGKPLV